ncbi:MAG: hypothetical protein C0398_05120 [Coprothermobacter sp.]|nr:hypothetical protein [Coprothermobacter sp.]
MKRWKGGKRDWRSWALGCALVVLLVAQLQIVPSAVLAATAVDDAATTNEDTAVTISVLGNDAPLGGLKLAAVMTAPGHGTAVIVDASAGTILYTPASNWNGTDTFTYTVSEGSTLFYAGTGHYYEFVQDAGKTWLQAKVAAEDKPLLYGRKGYLVTITSPGEQAFVETRLRGQGWMGASDETEESIWKWVTGPAAEQTQFCTQTGGVDKTQYNYPSSTGGYGLTPGRYANWAGGEPNNWGTGEDYAHFYSNGTWNDFDGSNTSTAGYVVEYGGMLGDVLTDAPTATVTVTVNPVNDAPSFTNGADQTVLEDCGFRTVSGWAISMSAGPAEEAGQTLDFVVTNDNTALFSVQPAIAANGTLTYAPAANGNGTATVTVSLHDNGGAADGGVDTSAPQIFTITVTPVNDAPQGVADSYGTLEDTVLSVPAPGVLANDADIDGPSIQAIFGSGPSHGSVSLSSDGSFRYTPVRNYNGSDSFRYSVWDGARQSSTVAVSLTITPVNDAPTGITLFSGTVPENVPLGTQVGWFTTQDPETTTGFTYTLPGEGADVLELFNVNYLRTKAGLDFETKNTYTLHVRTTDSGGLSYEQDFDIIVTNVNEAPVGANDSYTSAEDVAMTVSAPGVLANDIDVDGDHLTGRMVTGPAHGTLTLQADGSFTYVPVADYCGSDTFTYEAWDGFLASARAAVTLTVAAVNDVPSFMKGVAQTVLEDCGAQTVAGWATSISAGPTNESSQTLSFVVANDDNSLFRIQPAIDPATGTLTFAPATDQNGFATVTVCVHDTGGTANGGVDTSSSQTFTITVTPVNDSPVNTALPAISGTPHVGRTVATTAGDWNDAIDMDVFGTSVLSYAYQWQRTAAGGSMFSDIAGATSPSYVLTLPDNLQQVRVQVTCSDTGVGLPASQSTTAISLPVTILNGAPVITEGSAISASCDEDESPVPFSLTLHVTDSDHIDTLTWHILTPPAHGTLALPADPTGLSTVPVYHPALNWNGTDSFTLRVEDGLTGENEITVTVTVNPRNDAPVNTILPSISGTMNVGDTLTADPGTWSDTIDSAGLRVSDLHIPVGSCGWRLRNECGGHRICHFRHVCPVECGCS